MHIVAGVLRYAFLLLLVLFVVYVILLIRNRMGD
jgi:hypothetical protein